MTEEEKEIQRRVEERLAAIEKNTEASGRGGKVIELVFWVFVLIVCINVLIR